MVTYLYFGLFRHGPEFNNRLRELYTFRGSGVTANYLSTSRLALQFNELKNQLLYNCFAACIEFIDETLIFCVLNKKNMFIIN